MNIMDVVQGMSTATAMQNAVARGTSETKEQQQHNNMINAAQLGRTVAPTTVGALMGLVADEAIASAEKENPALGPKDPLSVAARNRFSPLGQIAFGRGYAQQPGIPMPSLFDRVFNTVTGREQQIPTNSMFNVRGNVFSNVVGGFVNPGTATGFETNFGGGEGPSSGMTSHGGMESAIGGVDASGYA